MTIATIANQLIADTKQTVQKYFQKYFTTYTNKTDIYNYKINANSLALQWSFDSQSYTHYSAVVRRSHLKKVCFAVISRNLTTKDISIYFFVLFYFFVYRTQALLVICIPVAIDGSGIGLNKYFKCLFYSNVKISSGFLATY